MTNFEEHLWSHLLDQGVEPTARPKAPVQARRRPSLVLGSAAALAAIAIAVIIALSATSATPPAFAITVTHDGTVVLTVREVSNLAAVNQRLAALGVPARIVPFQKDCPTVLSLPPRYLQPNTQPWSIYSKQSGPIGNWTRGIIPSRIPPGDTLVFALAEYNHQGWESANGFVKGPIPKCAAPYDTTLLLHGGRYALRQNANGTLTLNPIELLDPAKLQKDLAHYRIPAKVTTGRYCTSDPEPAGFTPAVAQPGTRGDDTSTNGITIDPSQIPSGTELSFGYFKLTSGPNAGNQQINVSLINRSSFSCSTTPPDTATMESNYDGSFNMTSGYGPSG